MGEPADLIALEADPLTADGDTLRRMPVALTLLGGRVTHHDPALNAGVPVSAAR